MLKVKINITKEILEKSMYCQSPGSIDNNGKLYPTSTSCAFALAFRDLFPEASVGYTEIFPFNEPLSRGKTYPEKLLIHVSNEMHDFICQFDRLSRSPEKRLSLPEQSFEVDIPDSVIDRIGVNEVNEILSKSLTMEKV